MKGLVVSRKASIMLFSEVKMSASTSRPISCARARVLCGRDTRGRALRLNVGRSDEDVLKEFFKIGRGIGCEEEFSSLYLESFKEVFNLVRRAVAEDATFVNGLCSPPVRAREDAVGARKLDDALREADLPRVCDDIPS